MMIKRFLFFTGIILCLSSSAPKTITWLAIGDSITYLNEHIDETGNRITKGYLTRLTEKFPNIKYVNQGHNGWSSRRMADQLEYLGLVKADVYTVFLGTNDWWNGQPIGTLNDYKENTGSKTVYGAFRKMVDKIRSLNDKAQIIFIT